VNDLELLTIQAEGAFDHRGRVVGWYGVTIACSADGQALWIGADVPDALANELAATFDPAPGWFQRNRRLRSRFAGGCSMAEGALCRAAGARAS
jgi:hypothetical protein